MSSPGVVRVVRASRHRPPGRGRIHLVAEDAYRIDGRITTLCALKGRGRPATVEDETGLTECLLCRVPLRAH